MTILRTILPVLLSATMASCSNHPLPQESTGLDTTDIVDNIRCEARAGLQEAVIEILRGSNYKNEPVFKNMTGAELADELTLHPATWGDGSIDKLKPKIREDFAFYRNSQIAYLFTLTMKEQNSDGIGAGFVQSYPGASKRVGTLGLSANATRTRSVSRIFNVVDTFEDLVVKVNSAYCQRPRICDIVYPIRGKLPVKDLMSSYIRINAFRNLAGPGETPEKIFGTDSSPAVPQMGDTITFTTKLTATVNPALGLTPPGLGFLLNSASFKTEDYRVDLHKVIVVVSTSPDLAKASKHDFRKTPPLAPEFEGVVASSQVGPKPKPIKNGVLTDARANYARRTLNEQLQTNFLNDISAIAEGFRRSQ